MPLHFPANDWQELNESYLQLDGLLLPSQAHPTHKVESGTEHILPEGWPITQQRPLTGQLIWSLAIE